MKLNPTKTRVYVAGRSGGHIIPCATIAREDALQGYKTIFVITNSPLDKKIIDQYAFLDTVARVNVARKAGFWGLLLFIGQLFYSFIQSIRLLLATRPERVISSGGYIAIPVCFAAWILRIPVELYELNVVPGKAIRLVSKIAETTHICFKETKKYLPRGVLGTYPVRFTSQDLIDPAKARETLGLEKNKKTIVILGGSQGSQFLNTLIISWLKAYPVELSTLQIVHQSGTQDLFFLKTMYAELGVKALVFDFKADMHYVYSAANIIIARAGAGTLFEINFFKKRSIIIPLEASTTDHQVDNAYAMASEHPNYFMVLRQAQATPEVLNKAIIDVWD